MKITVLCTDKRHPVVPYVLKWQRQMMQLGHEVEPISDKSEMLGGDFLFLISCSQMISATERSKYKYSLVLHASDLPKGRGWSPHIWALIGGERVITVCLLEANDPVDSGAVWLKRRIHIEDHMLLSEINNKLFEVELSLMTEAVSKSKQVKPLQQNEDEKTYWPKRTPEDSRLDPNKTLSEQFNILRLSDSERHPAFLDYLGHRYLIKLEKDEK